MLSLYSRAVERARGLISACVCGVSVNGDLSHTTSRERSGGTEEAQVPKSTAVTQGGLVRARLSRVYR
jgi:hypothetical protein